MQKLKKSIQKKLKKSLKNNLLTLGTQTCCFVLRDVAQKDVEYKVRSLTSNTMKKLGLGETLDTSILKFPLTLQTFKDSYSLKKTLIENNSDLKKNSPIIVRANNFIFKDKTYQMFLQQNIHNQIVKMRRSIFSIVSLLLVLKFHLKRIKDGDNLQNS